MTGHRMTETLDRLAERAPAPPVGLAEGVVRHGRVMQRRRRGMAAAIGAAVTVLAVAVVPVLVTQSSLSPEGVGPVADERTPTVSPSTPQPAPQPDPMRVSARMTVVAAAVEELLERSYPQARTLWIRDAVCASAFGPKSRDCTPLTKVDMQQLEWLLPHNIRWIQPEPLGMGPHPPVVSVAELDVQDDRHGSVWVLAVKGGLDCAGAGYSVTIEPGGRAVAKGDGSMAIC